MEIQVEATEKYQLIDISDQIQKVVTASQVTEGAVSVFVPHTSAAVMVEENEPGLKQDFYTLFKDYEKCSYHHPDGNAPAHILAGIIGHCRTVPIREGKLGLGTWQAILLVELDGPRQRRVIITVLPS
ncbi:YjbQ family protein [Candidatus Saccharibacteria bacterium]|nr:YjbQ family protein [Candidatus Saccharibacteria bacterium]